MRKFIVIVSLAMLAVFAFASVASAATYVKGYYKSNGTYVAPHYRSSSDGNFWNNYSSYGNTNPYTGSVGTKWPSYYDSTPSYNSYYTPSYRSYYTPSYSSYSYRNYYYDW